MQPVQKVRIALATTALFAVVQIVVETLTVALLYGGLVLQPRTFFNLRIYDAFAKFYAAIEATLGLPDFLNRFIGPGVWAKTAIGGSLVAVDLAPALIVGTAAGAVLVFVTTSGADAARSTATRTLTLIVGVSVAIHAIDWFRNVKFPVDPTALEMLRNLARNFLHDGTVIAFVVLGVAAGITWVILSRTSSRTWTVTAALGAVILVANGVVARESSVDSDNRANQDTTAAPAGPVAEDYNVILISIDSLRADHVGAYGYKRDTTPTIDALASDGVTFANASSTSAWTLPAHMSMITGRSLLGHGVVSDDRGLSDDVPTLAETLRSAGYTTAAIVSAPYVDSPIPRLPRHACRQRPTSGSVRIMTASFFSFCTTGTCTTITHRPHRTTPCSTLTTREKWTEPTSTFATMYTATWTAETSNTYWRCTTERFGSSTTTSWNCAKV